MKRNEFILEPTTNPINKFFIASGYGTIDCNHERVYAELLNSSDNYDQTFGQPIIKSNIVYLQDFPSKVLSYEEMVNYGKERYYWDSLNQKLYKFNVEESVQPFLKQSQVIVGCEGVPSEGVVDASSEFSKKNGEFNEVYVDYPVSTYITVHGHPSQFAPLPYQEGIFYFDNVHNKYYLFTSNYTKNINNWYYDKTSSNSTVFRYMYSTSSWTRVNDALVLSDNPNNIITITTGESDPEQLIYNIDEISKTICYCDGSTDTLYYFDYGCYFTDIIYTGVIYERPLDFYRKLQDVFIDINSNRKIKMKDIYYISGHPRYIKEPSEDRYYYDTRGQKYYEYNETEDEWTELPQESLMIPQTMFPHTNGVLEKKVTLEYYHIIDCYTKKEVEKLMAVIPRYISAFTNDVGYISEHQDISGKQDKLSPEELEALDSGVDLTKTTSWESQISYANNKQDALTNSELAALDSGINSSLVTYFDSIAALIEPKADKGSTLANYGITDAYTEKELSDALYNLIDQLDNAN